MLKLLREHKWFLISLFCAVFLAFFRFSQGIIQQDNYLGYAANLMSPSKISYYDSRLFPGLPILIFMMNLIFHNFLISGYIVIFISFIGAYILLYKMTGSYFSFLPLIFPPVMLGQVSLIATEFPEILIILLSIYLLKNKKYLWSSLILGFGFWIRPISGVIFVVTAVLLLKEKKYQILLQNIVAFLFPLSLFLLYNSAFFGYKNLLWQFNVYARIGHPVFGAAQIFYDIFRAFRWGWYRILISGLFYVLLIFTLIIDSLKKIKSNEIVLVSILLMVIYVFSATSEPFLENLGRYLAPTIPLFWLVYSKKFKGSKILYLMLPLSILVVLL